MVIFTIIVKIIPPNFSAVQRYMYIDGLGIQRNFHAHVYSSFAMKQNQCI